MGQHGRRTTIEDVALEAGVSVATVSRALRGLPNVADSTRHRVTDAAASLDYRPDPAATRLAAGRGHTITISVPTLNGWYFSTVVAGAEAVCAEAGYDFFVVGTGSLDDLEDFLHPRNHLERRTDGLILVDLKISQDVASSLEARGLTFATIGSESPGHPWVAIDDELVGFLATEHLTGLGHQRIGVIGGQPHDPMSFDVPRARLRGYERALGVAGIPTDEALFAPGNFGLEGGHEAMAQLLDLDLPPTAVFAMSDEMAFGAMIELSNRGLRAGVDVSIVGVDDHEFARVVGLTTIRQDVESHGATAARLLIDAMNTDDADDVVRHQTPISLVRRTSSAAPSR